MRSRRAGSLVASLVVGIGTFAVVPPALSADTTPGTLPFAQNWSSPSLITLNDNWDGVPSIIGYRGDAMATTNADPQTVLGDGSATPINVLAQSAATSATGGIHEIEASQVVALQGSGTADAPHLVVRLNTTGQTAINVAYTLVDLDADNAGSQQFALHYRVGGSGNYTNVPAGNVPDASGTQGDTFPVSALLPAAADNQPIVDVRIMTTDTTGSDSMTGVDDIVVTGTPGGGPALPVATCPATLVTPAGTPASADVSATDADSAIASIAITSPAVDGITLTPTGAGTATLNVAGTTAVGTYDVVIEFATDDDPPQTT
ncbi:MAG TPA: hypothetical protein VFV63_04025, partial [Ilumatobacteraceae bacterium]|nr:hypothetical protein [Ilumatobacteraceae bacterium]